MNFLCFKAMHKILSITKEKILNSQVDGNQGGPSLKNPLQVPDGPITRLIAKKIKEAMQGLV